LAKRRQPRTRAKHSAPIELARAGAAGQSDVEPRRGRERLPGDASAQDAAAASWWVRTKLAALSDVHGAVAWLAKSAKARTLDNVRQVYGDLFVLASEIRRQLPAVEKALQSSMPEFARAAPGLGGLVRVGTAAYPSAHHAALECLAAFDRRREFNFAPHDDALEIAPDMATVPPRGEPAQVPDVKGPDASLLPYWIKMNRLDGLPTRQALKVTPKDVMLQSMRWLTGFPALPGSGDIAALIEKELATVVWIPPNEASPSAIAPAETALGPSSAGKAYLRAIEDNPEAQVALERARAGLQAFADEFRANAASFNSELTARYFPPSETLEDWEHLARIIEIPAETIRGGKWTAREVFDHARAWADRQTIIAKLAAGTGANARSRQPAERSKRGRKPDTDPPADALLRDEWERSGCSTYAAFAARMGKGLTAAKVRAAVDRARKRP
jgi:hypothetical protein